MVYEVIVDIGASDVDKIFDYNSPFKIALGSRVLVPFGRRQIEGFVLGTKEKSTYETKDVIMILDETPSIIPEMLQLTKTLVDKYAFRYIDALRLFVPPKLRGGKVKIKIADYYDFSGKVPFAEAVASLRKSADKQREILVFLNENGETDGATLRKSFSASALAGLVRAGVLKRMDKEVQRIPYSALPERNKKVNLTEEQSQAVDRITKGTENRYLIHGVTGSGKTEIYLAVIERMLSAGKSAIMLVPEISLTPQMLAVFRGRFGDNVGILHSRLSDGERYDEWRKILTGDAKVVLGARSAVFAPVQNLGVVIIDEEHDGSYVSDREPRYTTEEIAMLRVAYNDAKLVLGSATPSIESYKKTMDGESVLITLSKRVNNKEMPELKIVNMSDELRRGNNGMFSSELLSALSTTLAAKEQAMVFINRRGYASFVQCRACGWVPKCPHCEVPLTYHKENGTLDCHYCGAKFKAVDACPICGFKALKDGKKGTEKVVEELKSMFSDVGILRLDNDTTTAKDACAEILEEFRNGKAQILVGTQMIAKGHDFPNVTLVGILDVDLGLFLPDFRSIERTFQLITQVAGRAGRENKTGRVILQTYSPNHYVYRYGERYDYKGFFDKESGIRKASSFPPYSKLVRVLITSPSQLIAQNAAYEFYEFVKGVKGQEKDILRIQFMNAPIARIADKYRTQVVIFIAPDKFDEVMRVVYAAAAELKNKKEIVVSVDPNPQQMM